MRLCADCGCRLSRYNPDRLCGACDLATTKTYDAYFASVAHTPEGKLRGEDTCKNGHDLIEHGRLVHAGGGRYTRRCSVCRAERQKQYQRNRRSQTRQAAA